MTEKEFVRKISSGQSRELINELVDEVLESKILPEKTSQNIILLGGRLNELEHKNTFGRLSSEDYNLNKNNINKAILELLPSLVKCKILTKGDSTKTKISKKTIDDNQKSYDLYISLPMTSLLKTSLYQYDTLRELLFDIVTSIKKCCGWEKIYCAALYVEDIEDVLDPLISASVDLEPIKKSKHYMLLYPEKLNSSCIVESGIALAYDVPSFYFVRSTDDLSYILREASAAFPNVYTKKFNDFNNIPDWIKKQGWKILNIK